MSFVDGAKVPVALVSDARTSFPAWHLPARVGGAEVAYLRAAATSKGPEVAFDVTPPNPGGYVLGRDMLVYHKITLNFTCARRADNPIVIGSDTAPRAFPFNSCVNTINLLLNNQSFSISNWNEIGAQLMRFNARENTFKYGSLCPWQPENTADYSQLTGSMLDKLSSAASSDRDTPRGGYTRCVSHDVMNNANPAQCIGAKVTIETWEPVNLSPLLYGLKENGLPFVQTFSLRFVMGDYLRMLSRKTTGDAVNFTGYSDQAAELYYQSIAAPLLDNAIPPIVTMPYHRVQPLTLLSPEYCQIQAPTWCLR